MKKSNIFSLIVEFVATAGISFLGSLFFSFLAFALFYQIEGEGGPGDGIGFLLILYFALPAWLLFSIIGVVFSNIRYKREQEITKRFVISICLPIVVTTIISTVMTVAVLNH